MSNVVYLKKEHPSGFEFSVISISGLFNIIIFKESFEKKYCNDLNDISFLLANQLTNGWDICDKSEFDEALNNFKNNLNLISDKL